MKKIIAAVALVTALALTGCGAQTLSNDSGAAKPAPSLAEPKAAPTPEPKPKADDSIVAFGEARTYENGVSISVSVPAPFTAGPYAAGVVAGQPQVVFTLVLTNNSTEILDPMVYSRVSAGGAEASVIFDSGNPVGEIGGGPMTAILPGQTVQWLEAYSVADPASITFQVSPSFEYVDAIFTNIQ